MTCKLIAIEGADNQGKTTLSTKLVDALKSAGYRAVYVKAPIKDAVFYDLIYMSINWGLATRLPTLFQGLNFFNKRNFQEKKLEYLRQNYDYIVLDRWKLSSFVYGLATGVSKSICQMYDDFIVEPDVNVILHGNEFSRQYQDALDSDRELQQKLERNYYLCADMSFSVFVKNTGAVDDVLVDIITQLGNIGII